MGRKNKPKAGDGRKDSLPKESIDENQEEQGDMKEEKPSTRRRKPPTKRKNKPKAGDGRKDSLPTESIDENQEEQEDMKEVKRKAVDKIKKVFTNLGSEFYNQNKNLIKAIRGSKTKKNSDGNDENNNNESENYVERGKQILKALDPEKYEQIKGLVKAIKGTKNKCSGTKCVDDTGDEQNGSDASDDNGSQRKRTKTEVVLDILHAIDPEQYDRMERLVTAVTRVKPECYSTRCSGGSESQKPKPDSTDGSLKVQDVLQALDPQKYDDIIGIMSALNELEKENGNKKKVRNNAENSSGRRPVQTENSSGRRPVQTGNPEGITSERKPANINDNRRPAHINESNKKRVGNNAENSSGHRPVQTGNPKGITSERKPANINDNRRPAHINEREEVDCDPQSGRFKRSPVTGKKCTIKTAGAAKKPVGSIKMVDFTGTKAYVKPSNEMRKLADDASKHYFQYQNSHILNTYEKKGGGNGDKLNRKFLTEKAQEKLSKGELTKPNPNTQYAVLKVYDKSGKEKIALMHMVKSNPDGKT